MSELPNLRKSVKIKFWSLRNDIGAGGGVVFDIDTEVERTCYRAKDGDDWKWVIRGLNKLAIHDWAAETDQETLDNYGSELEFTLIN